MKRLVTLSVAFAMALVFGQEASAGSASYGFRGDFGDVFCPFGRLGRTILVTEQVVLILLVSCGVSGHEASIHQALLFQDIAQRGRQGCVGSRSDGDPLIRQHTRVGVAGIYQHHLGSAVARTGGKVGCVGPHVCLGRVVAPQDDQPGVEECGPIASRYPASQHPACCDVRAVVAFVPYQSGDRGKMREKAVGGGCAREPSPRDGPCAGGVQNGLRPVPVTDSDQARRQLVQGLVPADLLELTRTSRTDSLQRGFEALLCVLELVLCPPSDARYQTGPNGGIRPSRRSVDAQQFVVTHPGGQLAPTAAV